ncbi:hypothetical protein GF314_04505 [bacterium]|nr:hypothetical protein [bacterium]
MLARRSCLILAVLLILLAGCERDQVTSPEPTGPDATVASDLDAELLAGEIMAVSGWAFDPAAEVPAHARGTDTKDLTWLRDWSREVLIDDIVHYTYLVQLGPGEYDRIRLHRVVREAQPQRPIQTPHTIFLQHGDAVGFVKFLYGPAAPSAPQDHAAAIHLAQQDIDVWGIDQNWVLVPVDVADFGFMQDWGMDNQIANLRLAMAAGRYARYFGGSGFGKLPLLGYSSGGWLAMAYANGEAVMPAYRQHAGALVIADAYYEIGPDNPEGMAVNCGDAAAIEQDLANGIYEWWVGFEEVGRYALDDPEGDSPIFEGFTNRQVALYFGCAGFRDYPLNAWWHYWGGEFDGDPEDPNSLPIDTRFLPQEWAFEFMTTASPWQANAFFYDYNRISCEDYDVPWDDNLAQITVPVLNLGGAGGLAPSNWYTLDMLGSTDIEEVVVQLLPDEQRFEDFGHIDMWTATDAAALVWAPLADWTIAHSGDDADQHPLGGGRD